jgi:hypothetical protein
VNWTVLLDFGKSLGAAALVGALLALHPLRLTKLGLARIDWDTVRSQVLIAVAGALMVVVVGDSAARAFGLVGIGAFVRFRTVMKNARDTAVLLILIGLGMACGLKLWMETLAGTLFFFLLLFIIDLGPEREQKKEPPMPLADDSLV